MHKNKACFPVSEFVRANREKSNLIGWRQTLTTSPTSPPNHIRFLLARAKKIAKWKTVLRHYVAPLSEHTGIRYTVVVVTPQACVLGRYSRI